MRAEYYLTFWIKEAIEFMREKEVFTEFVERLEVRLSDTMTKRDEDV